MQSEAALTLEDFYLLYSGGLSVPPSQEYTWWQPHLIGWELPFYKNFQAWFAIPDVTEPGHKNSWWQITLVKYRLVPIDHCKARFRQECSPICRLTPLIPQHDEIKYQ